MVATLVGAIMLIAPLAVAGHAHATDGGAPLSCLVCVAAAHGAFDLPVPVVAGAPVWHAVATAVPTPTTEPTRALAASSSRGPPVPLASPPH